MPHQGSPKGSFASEGGRTIADYKICSTLHVTETGTLVPNTSETSYGSSVALRQRHGTYKVSLILRSAPPVGLREAPREERPDAFAVESKERGLQQS